MKELAGKVALVTGGSRGIGAAIARRLAQEGAAVALTYVSAADKAQAVAKQIDADGGRVLVIQADNADPGAVTAAVERTVRDLGRIDILVNNAGIFAGGALAETTAEVLDRTWAIDVRAVFVASQTAARHMGEGGRIITIGSALAERVPMPGFTLYAMCKAALTRVTPTRPHGTGITRTRTGLHPAPEPASPPHPSQYEAGHTLAGQRRHVDPVRGAGRPEDRIAERLVHRDHVLVGLGVPCHDPFQLRFRGREQIQHRDLHQEAEPVSAVLPGHSRDQLVAPARISRIHHHFGQGSQLAGGVVACRDGVAVRPVPPPVLVDAVAYPLRIPYLRCGVRAARSIIERGVERGRLLEELIRHQSGP
jgi:3-oxoacyl-[acyl-carrier protein] reductase